MSNIALNNLKVIQLKYIYEGTPQFLGGQDLDCVISDPVLYQSTLSYSEAALSKYIANRLQFETPLQFILPLLNH